MRLPADALASRLASSEGRDDPESVALAGAPGPLAGLLAHVRRGSPFLWRLASSDQERLHELASEPPERARERIVRAQGDLHRRFARGEIPVESVIRELRRNRADHALLVALADLGGVWGLDEVVAALTAFADSSVRTAASVALAEACATGALDAAAVGPNGRGCGLVVLAYGKHGAGELNYSSDIDLVVFYDPAAPALTGTLPPSRLYNRIAQRILKLLGERTPDGYVHRVDYRLRPDPGSMPVAVSIPAAHAYYESVGQNWERAAMIKARPVAGDLALGDEVLGDLAPFVWRKYFDFATIADIHAMKRQIHAVRGHDAIAVAGHDIKLGRGGIREIEFFVQTQQLVFGGRRPELRGRRTLDTLRTLAEEGWIDEGARDELGAAYRFLRTIEHRLQMVADEQTQRLPAGRDDLARFSAFAGYRDERAFAAALTFHAVRVQHRYGLLFESAPELASERGDLVFTGAGDDPATLETLRLLGFADPAKASETVRGWHFGRRPAVTSARARAVLTELAPALLEAIGGTIDPDGALGRLDDAFGRMPAAVELLVLLRAHERLRILFADLLGSAPRLADEVAARPHALDALIEPGFAEPVTDEGRIETELRARIGEPASGEAFLEREGFLERLRDAAHGLQFLTGARLLSGILSPPAAGAAYAAIARAAIRVALDHAKAAFEDRHGRVPGGAMAVVGLGRLGAGDLTATSDLDLIVLYDFDPERRRSSGAQPLDAVVYYTRLTQRLISALTVPTRRGRLFAVDMRLRPSGTQGPVASQFSGFTAYHALDAELWEHMALTRARVLAGDDAFAARVRATLAAIVARPRDHRVVFAGVAAMRAQVAAAKGEGDGHDLKLARGGLVDLDFLAQALVLAHGSLHPDLSGRSTAKVLAEAGRLGLVDAGDAALLVRAYETLDGALHWQRLTVGDRWPEADRAKLLVRRLADLVGSPPDPGAYADFLDSLRAGVREAVARALGLAGRASATPPPRASS